MKIFKIKSLVIVLVLILLLPGVSAAIQLNLDYPEIGGLNININQDLAQIIAWVYYFVITVSGIAVFAMLVWGGFIWLTSTGDPSKIADARDRIYSAFLGLIIILASVLIITTINPALINLGSSSGAPPLPPPPSCKAGCDFELIGPCPPSKPAMTTVPGGVCCCPDICAPDCDFEPIGPCPPSKPDMTSAPGGVCCCPSSCPSGCDFEVIGPCPPSKPEPIPVSGGVCCCPTTCPAGCDFEVVGPCPPSKPNMTPIPGGVCCCPNIFPI